jgi:hypothetical protein
MARWSHGGGFSPDAIVRIAANDRRALERLQCFTASVVAKTEQNPGKAG